MSRREKRLGHEGRARLDGSDDTTLPRERLATYLHGSPREIERNRLSYRGGQISASRNGAFVSS
jgi:hypothetical protein